MSNDSNVRDLSAPARSARGQRLQTCRSRLRRVSVLARPAIAIAAIGASLVCFPVNSSAQNRRSVAETVVCGQGKPVTDASCQREFDDWQEKEKAWREHRRVWANYITYKGFSLSRVKRPEPPDWIAPYCQPQLAARSAASAELICRAFDDYERYDWLPHVEGRQAATTYANRVVQAGSADTHGFVDYLLKHVHYDAGWTNGQIGPRAFGLIGTHMTFAKIGRVYLWGPPGMLVVRRADGKIEVRMTYGVDLLLADIPVPFTGGRRVPLYMSVAKAFDKNEKLAIDRNVNAGLDMVGFSVTIRR